MALDGMLACSKIKGLTVVVDGTARTLQTS